MITVDTYAAATAKIEMEISLRGSDASGAPISGLRDNAVFYTSIYYEGRGLPGGLFFLIPESFVAEVDRTFIGRFVRRG